ncbi:MAG: hypothetical protein KDK40_05800 [Chlamydiia bacterium]|nr:hypothetical protein [Chlamydiia bacterium]
MDAKLINTYPSDTTANTFKFEFEKNPNSQSFLEASQESIDLLNTFNFDIWTQILSFVGLQSHNLLPLTCKHFYTIANITATRKRLGFCIRSNDHTAQCLDSVIRRIIQCNHSTLRIRGPVPGIRNCTAPKEAWEKLAAIDGKGLRTIDLSSSDIPLSSLTQLIRSSPGLSTFTIKYLSFECANQCTELLNDLATSCPQITSLNLKGVRQLDNTGAKEIAKMSCLLSLDLKECSSVSDLKPVIQNCTRLQELHLQGTLIEDDCLSLLKANCPDLHTLTYPNWHHRLVVLTGNIFTITAPHIKTTTSPHHSEILENLLRSQTCLKSLSININSNNITPNTFSLDCLNLMTALTSLKLSKLSQPHFEINLSSPWCLQKLFIKNKISHKSIQFLPHMTSLYCPEITDNHIQALSESCPNLTSLAAVSAEKISASGLEILATFATRLTTLKLRKSTFTENDLIFLATTFTRLSHLDLSSCLALNDGVFEQIVTRCPHLQLLRLMNCPALTNNAIKSICRPFSNLLHLDLTACQNVMTPMDLSSLKLPNEALITEPKMNSNFSSATLTLSFPYYPGAHQFTNTVIIIHPIQAKKHPLIHNVLFQ